MIGIKISKEGNTINDGLDKQYVDTDTPLFKLFLSDQGQQVYTAATGIKTFKINHNLGYKPMFFLYADRADSQNRKLVLHQDTSIGTMTSLWTVQVTKTDLVVTVSLLGTVSGTFGYNYDIYYDKVDS